MTAELVKRFGLDDLAAARLDRLVGLISADPHAPTTVRDPQRVIDDHLADSLVALSLPCVAGATAIADIGAGAGLPGLPLAIALQGAQVTLVEGNGRKCEYIEGTARALGLENVSIVHARAESWPEGIGRHDLVTARALAPLDVVAEYAAPLLRIGGSLVAWRGKRDFGAEAAAARAAKVLGLEVSEPIQVHPYSHAENRYLHVMSKTAETPDLFPRRPGMARKRPLGVDPGRDR